MVTFKYSAFAQSSEPSVFAETEIIENPQNMKPCSCAQFAPGCKFAPGSKFTPGCKFAPPLCPVHIPINCVHTHLDLIRNLTQGTHFYKKFAVFECSK